MRLIGGESTEWLRSESPMEEDIVETVDLAAGVVREAVVYSMWLVTSSFLPGMEMGAVGMEGGEDGVVMAWCCWKVSAMGC